MSSIVPVGKIKAHDAVHNHFDDLLDHVANGGSLTELARMWSCNYSEIMRLIRADEAKEKALKQAMADRKEWALERYLEELQSMGTYNIKDAYNPDGTTKPIHQLPDTITRAIKEIDSDGGIKLTDKLKAMDQSAKMLGVSNTVVEVRGELTLRDLILQAEAKEQAEKENNK